MDAYQCFAHAGQFHLDVESLVVGLTQQKVLGFMLAEHIEEEAAVGAHVAFLQGTAGHAFEHQPRDTGDVAELAFGHLRGVHAALQVPQQVLRREEVVVQRLLDGDGLVAEQLEAIVVHGDAEGDGPQQAHAEGEERAQRLVHQASFEGVDHHVVPLATGEALDEQFIR